MASRQILASAAHGAPKQLNAIVVSAGLMEKTVKVRIATQKWNSHIKKNFRNNAHLLVHDPASSLRTGDIVAVSAGWRTSKRVHHVVDHIIAPFGPPIEERPLVPTAEERIREKEEKRRRKDERRALRRAGKLPEVTEAEVAEVTVDGDVIESVVEMTEVQKERAFKASKVETEAKPTKDSKPNISKLEEMKEKENIASPKKTSWWG